MRNTIHTAAENAEAPAEKNGKRQRALLIIGTIFLTIALAWVLLWVFVLSKRETTDDAYVSGNQVSISTQIPGTVVAVFADDTQLDRTTPPFPADSWIWIARRLTWRVENPCLLHVQLHRKKWHTPARR
jgi:hypothetical protein